MRTTLIVLTLLSSGCVKPSMQPVQLLQAPVHGVKVYLSPTVDLADNSTAQDRVARFSQDLANKVSASLNDAGYSLAHSPGESEGAVLTIAMSAEDGWGLPCKTSLSLHIGSTTRATPQVQFLCISDDLGAVSHLLVNRMIEDSDMLALLEHHELPAPVVAAAPAPASPTPKRAGPVVAVFEVQDSTSRFDAATTDQFTDYVAARLASTIGFRIVPRDQLRARLNEEKSAGYKACYDESCQIELGKAVAAEKSLATRLLQVGSECAITATLFDSRTETTECAASTKTTCKAAALLTAADDLVSQLDRCK